MKVLVTGATGFVGSHAVAALVSAGHEVRVLARAPARVPGILAPLGAPPVEVVQGDVTDAVAVERAVAGCGGVLHAANVFTFDARRAGEMERTNVGGTELVIERAHAAGCDPIVHVSSTVALYPARGPIPRDPPIGTADHSPYARSKLAAERIARAAQDRGLPVVTTYPGAVYGPHDPGPGEMAHTMSVFLGNRAPFLMPRRASLTVADVSWLARAHAALFTPGQGARRITMGGHFLSWGEWFAALRQLTGRRLPLFVPTPGFMAVATGWLFDRLQPLRRARMPFSRESAWLTLNGAPTDDALAIELAGPPPPVDETLGAAITWLAAAGHLPPARAGRLAPPPAELPATTG